MIKTIFPVFCAIILLTACKSQQNSGTEDQNADNKSSAEVVEITQLATGGYSGIDKESQQLITSMEGFYTLWKQVYANRRPQPAIPEVNFEEELVVACFMGMRTSGGHSLEITEAKKSGSNLEVMITYSGPGRNCMVTDALTQPFYIGKVDKGDIKDASFSTKSQTVNCDE